MISPEATPPARKRWTRSEEEELLRLCEEGYEPEWLAKRFGIDHKAHPRAIVVKASRLRRGLRQGVDDTDTAEQQTLPLPKPQKERPVPDVLGLLPPFEGKPAAEPGVPGFDAPEQISDERGGDTFTYDPARDEYRFELNGLLPLRFPGDTVQGWFADYSRHGDPSDKGAQVRQMCRKYGLTPGLFDRLRRVLDLTHQAAPFAPHKLQGSSPEELVAETLQMREQKYFDALIRDQDTLTKQRLDELLKEHASREQWARSLAREMVEPLPIGEIASSYAVVAGSPLSFNLVLADLHTGKHVAPGVVAGQGADGVHERAFLRRRDELIAQLQTRLRGRVVEHAGLTLLGDLLESLLGTMHWGHAGEIWARGARQIRKAVEWLEPVVLAYLAELNEAVPLHVVAVGGNHDRLGADRGEDPARTGHLLVMMMLQERLREATEAGRIVWVSPQLTDESEGRDDRPWAGLTVGSTRYLAHHGDRSLTPEKLILLDQQDTGRVWPLYVILRGHLHGFEAKQKGNWVEWLCPSIVGGDAYSNAQLGFMSFAGAMLFTARAGDLWPSPDLIWLGGAHRAPQLAA